MNESIAYSMAKHGLFFDGGYLVVPTIELVSETIGKLWWKKTTEYEDVVYHRVGRYWIPTKDEKKKNPDCIYIFALYRPETYEYITTKIFSGDNKYFQLRLHFDN